MDATLHALGQILLGGVPTFFLVLLLWIFLRSVFFKPMGEVLNAREEKTEGARAQARASLQRAEEKAAAYEASLRAARNELYKEQEELRRSMRQEQTAQVETARRSADAMVKEAQVQLASQAAQVRETLAAESQELAGRITRKVLERSAA